MPIKQGSKISQRPGDLGYLYDCREQSWPVLKMTLAFVFTDSPWFRDGAKTEANWRMLRLRSASKVELSDGCNLPYDPQCLPLARSIHWPEVFDSFGPYLIDDPFQKRVALSNVDQFLEPRRILGVSATVTVD